MNRSIILAGLLASAMATPALATGLDQNQGQAQGQNQGQAQGQVATGGKGGTGVGIGVGKGGSAHSTAGASALSGANSGSTSRADTTVDSSQNTNQRTDASNSQSGDDTKINAYAASYTDAAPNQVQAAIGDGVVVTTWGVKVLGPIFGMTDQHVHKLPKVVTEEAAIIQMASTRGGDTVEERDSAEAKSSQASWLTALCGYNEELANRRFGADACDRIGSIVESTRP